MLKNQHAVSACGVVLNVLAVRRTSLHSQKPRQYLGSNSRSIPVRASRSVLDRARLCLKSKTKNQRWRTGQCTKFWRNLRNRKYLSVDYRPDLLAMLCVADATGPVCGCCGECPLAWLDTNQQTAILRLVCVDLGKARRT